MAPRPSRYRLVLTCSRYDPFAKDFPAERRALIGLAALMVSGKVPPGLEDALSQSDPLTLARDAQRLQVHTMVGAVLNRHSDLAAFIPADLVLFFRAMHAANRDRLTEGRLQLTQIGAALDAADIAAVVLKGGADMVSPIHDDPSIRYVGDLDILVPTNRAAEALAALQGLGFEAVATPGQGTSRFDWRGQRLSEHHLPRLIHSDWTFPVEIHVQVGPRAIAFLLDPDAVLDHRVRSDIAGLSLPCFDDRASHLLTHAQRHSGMASLRAWIDWAALREQCDLAAVSARFHSAGAGRTFENGDVMARFLSGGAHPMTQHDVSICRSALRNFGSAGKRSLTDKARFFLRRCRGLILSPPYRRHIAKRLLERGILGSRLSNDDPTCKLRQGHKK